MSHDDSPAPQPDPRAAEGLRVTVLVPGGDPRAGRIAGLRGNLLAVRFAGDAPRLEADQAVTVLVEVAPRTELAVTGRRRTVGTKVNAEDLLVIVLGVNPDEPDAAMRPVSASRGTDNRRAAVRVSVEDERIEVTLRPAWDPQRPLLDQIVELGRTRRPPLLGELIDVSAEGIGLRLHARGQTIPAVGEHVELAFALPGPVPLRAVAVLAWSHVRGRRIRCGFSLDEGTTVEFLRVQEALTRLVMEEQRRALRRKAQ